MIVWRLVLATFSIWVYLNLFIKVDFTSASVRLRHYQNIYYISKILCRQWFCLLFFFLLNLYGSFNSCDINNFLCPRWDSVIISACCFYLNCMIGEVFLSAFEYKSIDLYIFSHSIFTNISQTFKKTTCETNQLCWRPSKLFWFKYFIAKVPEIETNLLKQFLIIKNVLFYNSHSKRKW